MVGDDYVVTEEWNIERAEYDALDIESIDEVGVPMVETADHLTF